MDCDRDGGGETFADDGVEVVKSAVFKTGSHVFHNIDILTVKEVEHGELDQGMG